MSRRRPFAALVAMIALVFAQLLVSAHACDFPSAAPAGEVAAHPEGCPGAPHGGLPADNLCEQHCQYGHASVDNSPSAPAATNVLGPVLKLALAPAASAAATPLSWREIPALAAPPPAILFGVLRI
jgi:hypothetical protein